MSSVTSLRQYKIDTSILHDVFQEAPVLPEEKRLESLKKQRTCYLQIPKIINSKPFTATTAANLLKKVQKLKQKILTLSCEQESTLAIRGLNLIHDLPIRRNQSYLSIPATRSNFNAAFSFIEDPLKVISKDTPHLSTDGFKFSLPRKTHLFFINQLYGESPTFLHPLPTQGGSSVIKDVTFNGSLFVSKQVAPESLDKKEQSHQLQIEAKLYMNRTLQRHPNFIKLEAYQKDTLYLEKCPSGDFFEFSQTSTMSPEQILDFFKDIAKAIQALHQQNISYQDLKTENLLLSGEVLKLCDLGYAATAGSQKSRFQGTYIFAPPSKFFDVRYDATTNQPVLFPVQAQKPILLSDDIWSFGLVLFDCISEGCSFFLTDETINATSKTRLDAAKAYISGASSLSANLVTFVKQLTEEFNSSIHNIPTELLEETITSMTTKELMELAIRDYFNTGRYIEKSFFSNIPESIKRIINKNDPKGKLRNLIFLCLNPDERARINIKDILKILESP